MFVLRVCEMTGDFFSCDIKVAEETADHTGEGIDLIVVFNCGRQVALHTRHRDNYSSLGIFNLPKPGLGRGVMVTVDDATDSELQCRIIELEGDGKPSQRTDVVSLCGRLILVSGDLGVPQEKVFGIPGPNFSRVGGHLCGSCFHLTSLV